MRSSSYLVRRISLPILLLFWLGDRCFPQNQAEELFSSRISKARLLAQVRDLVRFGPRTGGTASGESAVSYVLQKFKEAGLKPTVQKDPPRLTFELKGWGLRVEEPDEMRALIKHAWVGAYSPSVSDTESELIYLRDPERVSRADLADKAVLIDNPISGKVYQNLVDDGVTCLLLASPLLEGAYSDWAMISDLPTSAKNRIPLFNLSRNNGNELTGALKDSQSVVIRYWTKTTINSARPKTVIATLKGQSGEVLPCLCSWRFRFGGPGRGQQRVGCIGCA